MSLSGFPLADIFGVLNKSAVGFNHSSPQSQVAFLLVVAMPGVTCSPALPGHTAAELVARRADIVSQTALFLPPRL